MIAQSPTTSPRGPIRAGVDRILLSGPRLPRQVAQGITDAAFSGLPGYIAGGEVPTPQHKTYRMMARLRPRRAGDPTVEAHYGPKRRHVPAFQLAVHSVPNSLVHDLTRILTFVTALERRLRVRITVAELEVAIDFTGNIQLLRHLQRQTLVPRTRRHRSYGHTWYWDHGGSSRQVRAYWNGYPRIEMVLRVAVLRSLRIQRLPDLSNRTWIGYCDRVLRFVEPRAPRRANATAVLAFLRDVATLGVTPALLTIPTRKRTRLRAYLQPSLVDVMVRDALAALRQRLRP